jgi:ATP-binding cassette, subfamily F, member 3
VPERSMQASTLRLSNSGNIDVLRLDHISKIYPTGEVLKDITWEVKSGERLGLVGPNGTGKTTQFKIIMGETEPTSGNIIKNAGLKIAYMTQEFEVDPDNTVREELSTVFEEIHDLIVGLHDVHKKLETATPDELDKLLRRMDRLQHEFEGRGGYAFEVKVDKILPEIGFSLEDAERKVGEFSGGWQMRISIGKILLQQPDVLLLDEPTNHLDLETIEWLETYLKNQTTPMVIVSHDRLFLDRLCNRIVEIERGVSTTYIGNYSRYQEIKEETRLAQQAAFERQQKELERQQVFIERFRASAHRSTQAKSREKQLEKVELIEAPESELRTLKFSFPNAQRSGRHVVSIKDITHAYDDNILFLGANLEIERGDKIAILGPNGAGKSTLLRLIMGTETPSEGQVTLGEYNVYPAYFEQNQAEALDLSKTLLDTIADEVPQWKTEEVRALLGKFLFSGDTVFKKVEALSGGEKGRLALAKMLLGPANLLILDEPTNHLDIPAKEMVEEAIQAYEGTVIVVSHDRYFISKVANKIVEIKDGQLRSFAGNYDYYCEQIQKEKDLALAEKLAAEEAARLAEKRAKAKEKERQKAQAKKITASP